MTAPRVRQPTTLRRGWLRTVYAYRITTTYLLVFVIIIALLAVL